MNVSITEMNARLRGLAERHLPSPLELYSVDGNVLFEIRGQSGGITSALIYYFVKGPIPSWDGHPLSKPKPIPMYGVEVPLILTGQAFDDKFIESVAKFQEALELNRSRTFDPNGGDLGRADSSR